MYAVKSSPAWREVPGIGHSIRLTDIFSALRRLDSEDDPPPRGWRGDVLAAAIQGCRPCRGTFAHGDTPHTGAHPHRSGLREVGHGLPGKQNCRMLSIALKKLNLATATTHEPVHLDGLWRRP